MSGLLLSRLLLFSFLINEAIVVARSSPEERKRVQPSVIVSASLLLLLLYFFVALPLPEPIMGLIILAQLGGLLLEISGEIQLSRANSFAITADSATQIQKNRLYRWLENPIYIGILVQVLAVSVAMPLLFITAFMMYQQLRTMVSQERSYLLSLNESHRGVDSFMWN
jgi:protein-S-isoprenylcysteine O-methyltransferase Ste14